MICFQISIFAESYTPRCSHSLLPPSLWFAFKLVSLQSHIHQAESDFHFLAVVICFQISIFAESYTPHGINMLSDLLLWFAFKLVSLQSHIHRLTVVGTINGVVICFQISIFAESYTPTNSCIIMATALWFAFKLVSLQSHIHPLQSCLAYRPALWFAFKLVSLQSHIHRVRHDGMGGYVVICFQISIFAESYTPNCHFLWL